MTPILMGSAANAGLAQTKAAQATTADTFDNSPTSRNLRLMGPPFVRSSFYIRNVATILGPCALVGKRGTKL
jgi:hypothetical protein